MPRGRDQSKNNNPTGRNQYSDWGVMEMARERPIAAAAAAAGAAAAGLFLWSRRSQINQQLSNLSDQIGEWTDNMGSSSNGSGMDDTAGLATTTPTARSAAGSRSASGTRARSTTNKNRNMSQTGMGTSEV